MCSGRRDSASSVVRLQSRLFGEGEADLLTDKCNFDHPATPQNKRTVSFADFSPESPAKKVQHLPPPSNSYVYAVFQDVLTESNITTQENDENQKPRAVTVAMKKSEKEDTRDVLGIYTTIAKANAKVNELVKKFEADNKCGQVKATAQEDGRLLFQYDQGKNVSIFNSFINTARTRF